VTPVDGHLRFSAVRQILDAAIASLIAASRAWGVRAQVIAAGTPTL
jgi:hypothetical protein